MKIILLNILLLFCFVRLNAQFYYLDVLVTKQTNQQYIILRNTDTRKVTATSYDGDEASKDFVLEQSISSDGRQITTRSASINNQESFFISNYNANRLINTVDSSANAINTADYVYDNTGRLLSITTISKDYDGTFSNTELHVWSYNEKGQPVKIIKVKNNLDTTKVTFTYDEAENVSEENWIKDNRNIETYYYYYNDKKQLTDVVRYNARAQKLLPDFMFEYDNAGHFSSMTQTQGGIANYLTWKYTYNELGLKQKEVVYSKRNELMGRIEYKYR